MNMENRPSPRARQCTGCDEWVMDFEEFPPHKCDPVRSAVNLYKRMLDNNLLAEKSAPDSAARNWACHLRLRWRDLDPDLKKAAMDYYNSKDKSNEITND